MDSDAVCKDRSELQQQQRFEVVVFELEVEELKVLVLDFVNGRLFLVGEELEFDPWKTVDAKEIFPSDVVWSNHQR